MLHPNERCYLDDLARKLCEIHGLTEDYHLQSMCAEVGCRDAWECEEQELYRTCPNYRPMSTIKRGFG